MAGKTCVFVDKVVPVLLCTPQIPHDLGSNPSRRGRKTMTNRLSYSTAPRKILDAGTGGEEKKGSWTKRRENGGRGRNLRGRGEDGNRRTIMP